MGKAFDIGTTIHQNKSEVAISFLKELAGLFEKHQVNCILTNIQRGAWGSDPSTEHWFVGNGEYATKVNYCPCCGIKLEVPKSDSKENGIHPIGKT